MTFHIAASGTVGVEGSDSMSNVTMNLMQMAIPLFGIIFVGFVVLGIAKMFISRRPLVEFRPTAVTSSAKPSVDKKAQIAKAWALACSTRDEFITASAQFEVGEDALADQLFRRPLLTDVTEPLTAAWLDAKSDFDVRFPEGRPKTIEEADRALALARTTRNAWNAAERNARRVGLGNLSDAEARRLDLAQQLLTAARDRGTAAGERRSQVLKVVEILASLTGRSEDSLSSQIETVLNPWLKSIDACELHLAIEAAPNSAVPSAITSERRRARGSSNRSNVSRST